MEGMPLIAHILLAALMLPIELVSHFARLLSLTVRLWANIFAGDLITLVFFSMIPIGVPIIFSGLAHRGRGSAGICVHAAVDHLCVGSGGGRALEAELGRDGLIQLRFESVS